MDLKQYGGYALVTGASAGIGECYARRLAEAGVSCVLVARRAERLAALCDELQAAHDVDMRYVAADLSDEAEMARLVEATAELEVGMLFNNAGFGDAGRFETRDPERLAQMVKLNCLAPVVLSRAYVPAMLARGRGALVMVSSGFGLLPAPYEATYAATKAFDLWLGEGLWGEYRGRGIDVITVCPAATETEFLLAEGHNEKLVRKMYQRADSPEHIADITLRGLGRRPVAFARDVHLIMAAQRLLPRWMSPLGAKFGLERAGLVR